MAMNPQGQKAATTRQRKADLRAGHKHDRQRLRASGRDIRRRQWRCFWTRPFGHAYEANHRAPGSTCVGCEKGIGPWGDG